MGKGSIKSDNRPSQPKIFRQRFEAAFSHGLPGDKDRDVYKEIAMRCMKKTKPAFTAARNWAAFFARALEAAGYSSKSSLLNYFCVMK
jgi:hypothetical protein